MKKQLLTLFILPFLGLTSCQKKNEENKVDQVGKTYKVGLSVTGNTGGSTSTLSETPLKDLINQLTLVVYRKSDGKELSRRTQFSTSPDFGQIDLNLPADAYTLVAIGSKSTFGINELFTDPNSDYVELPFATAHFRYLQADPSEGQTVYKTDDTFFGKKVIQVGNNTKVHIELNRIVGKLEVTVEDSNDYTVFVENEATGFKFNEEVSFAGIQNDYGRRIFNGQKSFSGYFLRTDQPLKVTILNNSKYFHVDVPVYKNRVTTLKGKFSNLPGDPDFSVSINDKWSTDTTKVEF